MISQGLGNKGILKIKFKNVPKENDAVQREWAKALEKGYYPIFSWSRNNDIVVSFYFSYLGENGLKDLGANEYWIWSSSPFAHSAKIESDSYPKHVNSVDTPMRDSESKKVDPAMLAK